MERKVKDYTLGKKLGKGGYGQVYQAQKEGVKYAAKIIEVDQINLLEIMSILQEVMNSSSLKHQNLVQTIQTFKIKDETNKKYIVVIIMEICDEGTLNDKIGKLSENQCLIFAQQIAMGIQFLHQYKNIIHCDIKPENILIKAQVAKIADFGLSKTITQQKSRTLSFATQYYLSPEAWQTKRFKKQDDIWALGVTFLEIFLGKKITDLVSIHPFQIKDFPSKQLIGQIKNENLRQLIKRMLARQRKQRIKIKQVREILKKQLIKSNNQSQESLIKTKINSNDKQDPLKDSFKKQNEKSDISTLPTATESTISIKPKQQEKSFINTVFSKIKQIWEQLFYKENQETSISIKVQKEFIQLLNSYNNFPNLQKVNLKFEEFSHQGLKTFAQHSQKFYALQILQLHQNKITDKGLTEFVQNCGKFPNLKKLKLSQNKIGNDGFKNLIFNCQKFPNLEILQISWNKISDNGLKVLGTHSPKLKSLKILELSWNQISDQGLKSFVDSTVKFSGLQLLYLSHNGISDEGLKVLSSQSEKFPNLQKLYLSRDQTTPLTRKLMENKFTNKIQIFTEVD